MSKVQNINLTNLTQINDLIRFLNPFCSQVSIALNNGLSFQDNIRSSVVQVKFPTTANQSIQIKHGLATTPIGYIPIQMSAAGAIYNGISLILGPTFASIRSNISGMTATILFF